MTRDEIIASKANLAGADLFGADLSGADLRRAYLPPAPMLLFAQWGDVSNDLCRDLMRYDAANHPNPALFDVWAAGGPCPMSVNWQRSATFNEERVLWSPGESLPAFTLLMRLFAEKGISR